MNGCGLGQPVACIASASQRIYLPVRSARLATSMVSVRPRGEAVEAAEGRRTAPAGLQPFLMRLWPGLGVRDGTAS